MLVKLYVGILIGQALVGLVVGYRKAQQITADDEDTPCLF